MKKKSTLLLFLTVIACIHGILTFTGCQESEKVSREEDNIPAGPFFYPSPPDFPRIQFLKSFSGPEVAKKEVSGFEAFIVGEEEIEETAIKKPFGFALYENKLYICDIGVAGIAIFDLDTGELKAMKRDSRMVRPLNICIDNGNKYIADSKAVFVYSPDDELLAIWGREEGLKPMDVSVQEQYLYVLDGSSSQVVVLDKTNGKEINRLGVQGEETGQLQYVNGLAIDEQGSVYISDLINAHVTKLNSDGVYQQTFGFRSLNIHGLSRPKGIDVDKEGRLWVVDAATNVAKVFDKDGQLLLYFAEPGFWPGDMYLPASIRIDYDHIDTFQKYAVAGAQLECLIIVSNQFGPHKISVYGLGKFPSEEARILKMKEEAIEQDKSLSESVIDTHKADIPEDVPE